MQFQHDAIWKTDPDFCVCAIDIQQHNESS